jgi:hypothetical protein
MLNIRARRRRAAASGCGHFNLCDHSREFPVATRSLDVVAMGIFSPPAGNAARSFLKNSLPLKFVCSGQNSCLLFRMSLVPAYVTIFVKDFFPHSLPDSK